MDDESLTSIWHMPQPIVVEARSAQDRKAHLELLRAVLPDPEDLSEFDPTFFRVIASDQSLDSYFTRMSESTIKNYVEDAKRGVSLQQSHNGMRSLGFGRSLDAEVTGPKSNLRAEILFYTVPGIRSGEITSTELITGIKSGIYRDVSVGFTPDYFECSICGGDPTDWRAQWDGDEDACYHIPGLEYKNERGKTETAWAWIHGARLNEVSFVYDGSNQNAGILAIEKARMIKAKGKLPVQVESILEQRYRTRVPDLGRNWRGERFVNENQNPADSATEVILSSEENDGGSPVVAEEVTVVSGEHEGERTMEEETAAAVAESEGAAGPVLNTEDEAAPPVVAGVGNDQRWAAVRAKYEGDGKLFKKMGDDPIAAIDTLADALVRTREQLKTNARAVKMGEAYEKKLVDQAHVEGVRFYGDRYNRAHWESLFSRMEAEEIELTIEQWTEKASARFPGGRVTSDMADRAENDRPEMTDSRYVGV